MRTVTPSAAFTDRLLDIRSSSALTSLWTSPGRIRAPGIALADARQLFADEHVYEAPPAEDGLHHHAAGAVVGHVADDRGPGAEGVRLERRQGGLGLLAGHDADDLALVGEVERVEAQNLAEALDLAPYGRAVFVYLDPDLRRLGDLVQDGGEPAARRVAQEARGGDGREQRVDEFV